MTEIVALFVIGVGCLLNTVIAMTRDRSIDEELDHIYQKIRQLEKKNGKH